MRIHPPAKNSNLSRSCLFSGNPLKRRRFPTNKFCTSISKTRMKSIKMNGGPFDGNKILLTGTITLTFSLNGFRGFYRNTFWIDV